MFNKSGKGHTQVRAASLLRKENCTRWTELRGRTTSFRAIAIGSRLLQKKEKKKIEFDSIEKKKKKQEEF